MKRLPTSFYILRVFPSRMYYHRQQCRCQSWKKEFFCLITVLLEMIQAFTYWCVSTLLHTKFIYLTGDAEGLIVGPDLISCLNEDPRCTIGCWTGLAKSEFEILFAVFKSAPTIKSTGLAEPWPLLLAWWGKPCWFPGVCCVRSGGLIVFNAENKIRYHY